MGGPGGLESACDHRCDEGSSASAYTGPPQATPTAKKYQKGLMNITTVNHPNPPAKYITNHS